MPLINKCPHLFCDLVNDLVLVAGVRDDMEPGEGGVKDGGGGGGGHIGAGGGEGDVGENDGGQQRAGEQHTQQGDADNITGAAPAHAETWSGNIV